MKKFLLIFLMLLLVGCGNRQKTFNVVSGSMYGYEQILNQRQVDSLCMADTLKNYEEWITSTYYDYETAKRITKYTYIKEYTDSSEVVYILVPKDTLFLITKRVGKND